MLENFKNALEESRKEIIELTQRLVQIQSYSGQEEEVIKLVAEVMEALDYDEVIIDSMGNVLGRVGHGEQVIMFDSHVDTVEATDDEAWDFPPFSGEISNGKLYGRGSVDMKSSAAASIYAGAIAKELNLLDDKTILVSCTVNEEDCDGENLKHLFKEYDIKPDYYVTCEPSDNKIVTGHRGKAQLIVKTKGISSHGSAPEKGKNAVYEMAEIIQRVEQTNEKLMNSEEKSGTVVLSDIKSKAVSLNAVPYECEIHLDRRLVLGEDETLVEKEMEAIVKDKDATWDIATIKSQSWTGHKIAYRPLHMPWQIEKDHEFMQAAIVSYEEVLNQAPEYDFWDFSTNAVTPISMGIPTIGFGPGVYKLAHCKNEHVEIDKIIDACEFYTTLITKL